MATVRMFVIWDSEIEQVELLLTLLEGGAEGVEVSLLGRDKPAGVPSRLVASEIGEAQVCLALMDQPNANVGWEIGYALGAGKAVRLVTAHGPATWCDGAPFEQELVHPGLMDPDEQEKLFPRVNDAAWFQAPGRRPHRGGRTLLLCPQDPVGKAYTKLVAKRAAWSVPDRHRWTLADLGPQLDGVARVVWVVPQPGKDAVRDTPETARLAVLAGFAQAVGLEVVALCQDGARKVLDAWNVRRRFGDPAEFEGEVLRLVDETPGKAADPLAALRRDLREQTRRLTPFLDALRGRDLPGVYVPLEVARSGRGADGEDDEGATAERAGRLFGHGSLRELLDRGGRWALVADPGAGKTTTLRHLVHELAGEGGVIAVHVPLYAWAAVTADVFDFVASLGTQPGLADRLRDEAGKGRLWLLLDGLDEVPRRAKGAAIRDRLAALARDWPHLPMVVAGRPEAFTEALPGFEPVSLLALTTQQQAALLEKLAPGAPIQPEIARRPMLANLARNPLMLTLIALTARAAVERGDPLPVNRADVYEKAARLLLDCTFSPARPRVKDTGLGIEALQRLAFRLMGDASQVWAEERLTRELIREWGQDKAHREEVQVLWDSPRALLEDVEHGSGLIGRHDGPSGGWRWLHRSLGEWLAAKEAVRRGPEVWEAWKAAWEEDGDGGAWGEAFGLLCGMVPEPARFLRAMTNVPIEWGDRAPVVRAMLGIDGLDPALVVELWEASGQGPDDDLAAALELTGAGPAEVTAALWGWVTPGADADTLGLVWDTLDLLGATPDREGFFRACGKALPGDWRPSTCRVPAGTSWRGSPDGVGEHEERPRHRVTHPRDVWLTTTPVTHAEYRRLWPDHGEGEPDDLPAVLVSWYAALLYAAWLGAELPTEAQWEHACRAGTDTAYSFGDDTAHLGDYAWFDENSDGDLHPVGQKLPNRWGLRDMHGLVLEWCLDVCARYDGADAIEQHFPRRGDRCLRGGSFRVTAGGCRSASRDVVWQGWADDSIGFRVLFPAPADAG